MNKAAKIKLQLPKKEEVMRQFVAVRIGRDADSRQYQSINWFRMLDVLRITE